MVAIGAGMEAVSVTLPVIQIVYGSRPYLELEIAKAFTAYAVVRAVQIHSVAEHPRLTVGNIFPEGKNRIGHIVLLFCLFSLFFLGFIKLLYHILFF